jgi:hypothetical protein
MTISASSKKEHPRFFSERIHAPADSFISRNEGMNELLDRICRLLQQFPVDLNQDGLPGLGEALWH